MISQQKWKKEDLLLLVVAIDFPKSICQALVVVEKVPHFLILLPLKMTVQFGLIQLIHERMV